MLSLLLRLLSLQERISSGRSNEALTVYHEGGQLLPAGAGGPGDDAELMDRLACGVKILSGECHLMCSPRCVRLSGCLTPTTAGRILKEWPCGTSNAWGLVKHVEKLGQTGFW